ncbi:glutathione S-transferase [Stutzerimonas marianensis]|uniref:glutathione S-transferase n=1 Tax=Stutzerimonas marianensis TaxID=2929513 RepID=UPI003C2ED641
MLTLHHLENSRSHRVLWLLEELELPYEIKRYARDSQTLLAPDELKAIHPLGKAPILCDEAACLAESGAILEYLAERYAQGPLALPKPGTPEHLKLRYWMHYAEGSAMPPLLLRLVFDRVARGPMPFFIRPVARAIANGANKAFIGPQLNLHLDYMESELSKTEWFAGQTFTIADIQMSFPLEAAEARAGLDGSRPRLMDFLRRIRERPAYQRAVQRGGPVMSGR